MQDISLRAQKLLGLRKEESSEANSLHRVNNHVNRGPDYRHYDRGRRDRLEGRRQIR